jgi:hypothetical protein
LGDADDKPSVPHAHSQETGYRLNAWTGDIYPAGAERGRIIGKLTDKELRKLHKDPKFLKFAGKHVEWYRETYPQISFYIPEWFTIKNSGVRLGRLNKEEQMETFVFLGKAIMKP